MEYCIFCKIVKGELFCHKVYEDRKYIGFLDHMPLTRGNTLLIPKQHFRWVYDVPDFGEYWEIARKVGTAIQSAMRADSINFLTIGEEIPHAHIRIIPRYSGDLPFQLYPKNASDDKLEKIAEKIRSNL